MNCPYGGAKQIMRCFNQMLNSLFERFDSIIVLDTETTGLSFRSDEIIELAAVRATRDRAGYKISDEFDVLISLSEGVRLSPEITKITGIDEQMLREDGVSKAEACARLSGMLAGERILLAAYNAQFDLCFLYYFLASFGRAELLKNVKMLDVLTVYKDRREYPHKLSDAIKAFDLKGENSHRALDDTRATLELLAAMEQEAADLERYINLFGFNPKYGVSGPRISSVNYQPQGYRRVCKLYEMTHKKDH